MEVIVTEAKEWVDKQGRVIDPFAKKETGQASPRFASPGVMAPMPVLGIPGWHPETANEGFYDDAGHFRPGRRRPGSR